MATAPKDGRPVWARGNNFNDPAQGQHSAWVYWNGVAWQGPMFGGVDGDTFLYLTEWMKETQEATDA